MPHRITVLNGPNLNLLGTREPQLYGTTTLAEVEAACRDAARALGAKLTFLQTNHEGVLIEQVHAARKAADAIVINPAGFSFTSVALFDALKTFEGPILELHVTNIHARDDLHRHSIQSAAARGVICGLGTYGYLVALQAAAQMLGALPAAMPKALRRAPGAKAK